MKFLYADSLDYVDPDYDFVADRHGATRRAREDDEYPHEHLERAPYDGLLISRAIVGGVIRGSKYTPAQAMRFAREGARKFIRFPTCRYPRSMIMGDCGAFSYRNAALPPYTVGETLEFYHDAGFTHGCSVDHLIFDFIEDGSAPSSDARARFDVTQQNARDFLRASKKVPRFTPMGVVQGWSPASMAEAARKLVKMGYTYLAVGGMVPLRTRQIDVALEAIRDAIPAKTKLHVLGFGKTDDLGVLDRHAVTSFDTTSPLRRAFMDAKRNYYALRADGDLDYYTAVRIPQAVDNDDLLRRAKRGRLNQEKLLRMERDALETVRALNKGGDPRAAADAVVSYGRYSLWDDRLTEERNEKRLAELHTAYLRTLGDRPWARCSCRVCCETGVEALIFRSSNRNKRRGIHNLHVFYGSLCTRFRRS